jgi:hypothetical protein
VELQDGKMERKRFIICYLSSFFFFRYIVFLVVISFAKIQIFSYSAKQSLAVNPPFDYPSTGGRLLGLCVSGVAATP